MISLDTNAISDFMQPDRRLIRMRYRDAVTAGRTIAVSSIVLFELQYGVARSSRRHENSLKLEQFMSGPVAVLPFDAEDALVAGEVRTALELRGTPIGPYDVLIAGQALRHGATLVTAKVREFSRVPGLMVEDWVTG